MSLLPYLFETELYPRHRHGRLLDQHFGLDLAPDDLLSAVAAPLALMTPDYYRPWRQLAAVARDVGSTVTADKDKVEMKLDVEQFKPEDISVKISNGFVVVEGKHEEKQENGSYVSRQFVRRYALPKDCLEDKVESKLSSDGVLVVTAPRQQAAIAQKDSRKVSIEQTGPARNQKEEKMEE